MTNDRDASSDDLSGLTSFFFYMFIVHPCTAWILKPGRFQRKNSILYAISFLAALAACKTGMEMNSRGPNYYFKLQVTRSSSPLELKRAFKKLSLRLHPDKNPSPDATAQFDDMKQAYDILMDMELREVYNKFGKEGVASNKRFEEMHFFLELGIFYVTWAMLAFVLTLGKRNRLARDWTFTGLGIMLVLEIMIMTSPDNPFPTVLFPRATEHEAVWLLHALFPAYTNGCRSLGSFLYEDIDEQTRRLLLDLTDQNKEVLLVLREIQILLQSLNSSNFPSEPNSQNAVLHRATPTGKLKELQDRLKATTQVSKASRISFPNKNTGSSSLGFYFMIMGYIAVSYFFNK